MCLTGAYATARADSPPATVTFSPQGTIKNVRQAVAHFSQPMVPLGDPRVHQSPFQIDCPGTGWHDCTGWRDGTERRDG